MCHLVFKNKIVKNIKTHYIYVISYDMIMYDNLIDGYKIE